MQLFYDLPFIKWFTRFIPSRFNLFAYSQVVVCASYFYLLSDCWLQLSNKIDSSFTRIAVRITGCHFITEKLYNIIANIIQNWFTDRLHLKSIILLIIQNVARVIKCKYLQLRNCICPVFNKCESIRHVSIE